MRMSEEKNGKPERVNLVRMHDAQYRYRKRENISLNRVRMYKGQTRRHELWNLVRMYDALKQEVE